MAADPSWLAWKSVQNCPSNKIRKGGLGPPHHLPQNAKLSIKALLYMISNSRFKQFSTYSHRELFLCKKMTTTMPPDQRLVGTRGGAYLVFKLKPWGWHIWGGCQFLGTPSCDCEWSQSFCKTHSIVHLWTQNCWIKQQIPVPWCQRNDEWVHEGAQFATAIAMEKAAEILNVLNYLKHVKGRMQRSWNLFLTFPNLMREKEQPGGVSWLPTRTHPTTFQIKGERLGGVNLDPKTI